MFIRLFFVSAFFSVILTAFLCARNSWVKLTALLAVNVQSGAIVITTTNVFYLFLCPKTHLKSDGATRKSNGAVRNNYCPTLNVNGKQCSQFDPRISSAEKRRKNNAKKVDETTREIQNKLNGMGFQAGVADGLYGTKTKNALNQFYSSIGKTYDGKPSQNEIRDLNKYKGTNSFQLRRVKTAQHYLNALGFNAGAEDGVYGAKQNVHFKCFIPNRGRNMMVALVQMNLKT